MLLKGSPTSEVIVTWCHKKLATLGEVWHLAKSENLDYWLQLQIPQHADLHTNVLYAEVWEGNFGNKKMTKLWFDKL